MKVYTHPDSGYESKLRQVEEKLEKSRAKNRHYATEHKNLKRRVKALELSRANWKGKSKVKSIKIKTLQNCIRSKDRIDRHHYPLWMILLCVQLRILGGSSYRGIRRILGVLQCSALLSIKRLPSANTIENWVTKVGYYYLQEALSSDLGSEVCLIVDESIGQGNERLIAILAVSYHKHQECPLSYDQVRLCYLGGKSSWNGEKIKQVVSTLVQSSPARIRMILSDEDSKLLNAARLLGLSHLPDINHALASCLRRSFEKKEEYEQLIKLINSYQARSVNQALSYLRPPKQRVKARFMNQKAFVTWGLKLLARFDRLQPSEQLFFAQLRQHRPMLELLGQCIDLAEQIAKRLKTSGLNQVSLKEAQQIVIDCDDQQPLKKIFCAEVNNYLEQYEDFLQHHQGCFHVSSDIIESLFGKHKYIRPSNPLVGVSQIQLELPAHCVRQESIESVIREALKRTFMTDLSTWVNTHSSDKQAIKRNRFFKNST